MRSGAWRPEQSCVAHPLAWVTGTAHLKQLDDVGVVQLLHHRYLAHHVAGAAGSAGSLQPQQSGSAQPTSSGQGHVTAVLWGGQRSILERIIRGDLSKWQRPLPIDAEGRGVCNAWPKPELQWRCRATYDQTSWRGGELKPAAQEAQALGQHSRSQASG